jgi:hypothetical protein
VVCLRAWLDIAAAARDHDAVTRAATLLERDACVERTACAKALSDIGDLVSLDDPTLALGFYMRAAREEGTRGRWIRAARVARMAGQHGDAVRALEMATSLGGDPEAQRALDREKLEVLSEAQDRKH